MQPTHLGNDDAALRYAWHPVAFAADLGEAPISVRVCGEPWVLARLGTGPAAGISAFPDRCPHRRVPLSAGRVVGAELECAYHGWRFDSTGACTSVPALGADVSAPRGMRVDRAAGCVERYGLVWLAPSPPVVELPDVPEYDDSSLAWAWLPPQTTRASAGVVMDNFFDVAHFSYIHGRTFGLTEPVTVEHYEVSRDGWAACLVHSTVVREDLGGLPRTATYALRAPFTMRLELCFPSTGVRSSVVIIASPAGADATVIYKAVAWPVTDGPAALAREIDSEIAILEEDITMLDRIADPRLPLDLRAEQHTKADRASVELRRVLADLAGAAPAS